MVGYRCYILDADDHIVQAHELDCDTDTQARRAAERLLGRDPYHRSAEVWNASRRVMRLERAPARSLRLARPPRELGSMA